MEAQMSNEANNGRAKREFMDHHTWITQVNNENGARCYQHSNLFSDFDRNNGFANFVARQNWLIHQNELREEEERAALGWDRENGLVHRGKLQEERVPEILAKISGWVMFQLRWN